MSIFGDFIDDKIFPKANKKFIQEEKILIDQFIELIYKNFKSFEIEYSDTDVHYDDPRFFTESISKTFSDTKKKKLSISFFKIYCSEKKFWFKYWEEGKRGEPVDFLYVGRETKEGATTGYSGFDFFHGVFKINIDEEGFDEFKKNNKVISGIWCRIYYDRDIIIEESIPTKYAEIGDLTKDSKKNIIKKYFPNMIKKLKAKIG